MLQVGQGFGSQTGDEGQQQSGSARQQMDDFQDVQWIHLGNGISNGRAGPCGMKKAWASAYAAGLWIDARHRLYLTAKERATQIKRLALLQTLVDALDYGHCV
ncbi:hypothetical protein Pres01_33590 [Metapseudomonas resinovorans]|nr:hypothetical protein Pres01_33590 [Pseudomonas resinovorans]